MRLIPDPESLLDSASNGFDLLFGGGPADLTRQPSSIIDEGPQRIVHRYRNGRRQKLKRAPVLLVPPLAAPASCFDLRRGCSVAEHLIGLGYPTYLVDYGSISFGDRQLGLEHWVDDVLPSAIRIVSEDAGGRDVQVVGWCLGGIMALLSTAGQDRPGRSGSPIARPLDSSQARLAT